MDALKYQTPTGKRPFDEWLRRLRDKRTLAIIHNRLRRLRYGQFGDCKHLGDQLWEMRIFWGPGYRIYFIQDGLQLVILLLGGDKDSQERDIHRARSYALDYWMRK